MLLAESIWLSRPCVVLSCTYKCPIVVGQARALETYVRRIYFPFTADAPQLAPITGGRVALWTFRGPHDPKDGQVWWTHSVQLQLNMVFLKWFATKRALKLALS